MAIDLNSGAVVWTCVAGKTVRATPAVAGGVIYAGSAAQRLVAADMATGRLRWALAWEHSFNAPPVVVDGLLVAADSAGCVATFDIVALEAAAMLR